MSDRTTSDEVALIAKITDAELAKLNSKIQLDLNKVGDSELANAFEKLVLEVGRLSTRVKIVEDLLLASLDNENQENGSSRSDQEIKPETVRKVSVDDLHDYRNFHDIETDEDGNRFAWTVGREFHAKLRIAAPENARYVQVFFVAIVRPSYAESATLKLNGIEVEHRTFTKGKMFCFESKLPDGLFGAIALEVSVPATHPLSSSKSNSEEWREGGIAVSRVVLAERSSAPLLKRLLD
ncbi:MAG: hypothetical protein AAF558_03385 [Verrucomicrobiota bacterium]